MFVLNFRFSVRLIFLVTLLVALGISLAPEVYATSSVAAEAAAGSNSAEPLKTANSKPQGGGGGLMGILPLFGIIFLIFYIMVLRPQEKERRLHQQMLDGLKPGSKVVTTGGMIGKVFSVNEEEVVLEVASGVRSRFLRSAVIQLLNENTAEKKDLSEKKVNK